MMQELANHFIAWANENAHPLKSFETADFNDLAFLCNKNAADKSQPQ